MYNWSNCDRKSQLPEILTEPLNPRDARFPMFMCIFHIIDQIKGAVVERTLLSLHELSFEILQKVPLNKWI